MNASKTMETGRTLCYLAAALEREGDDAQRPAPARNLYALAADGYRVAIDAFDAVARTMDDSTPAERRAACHWIDNTSQDWADANAKRDSAQIAVRSLEPTKKGRHQ